MHGGNSCHIVIVCVAVGDDVLRYGVDVGGHGTCLGELAHDRHLISRFGNPETVWNQVLVMVLV